MHITHHFTPGLRFDTFWKYQTLTPSGNTHWTHLPLSTGTRDDLDPHGAWWCSRRCAAVLLRRSWQATRMPYGLPVQPGAADVEQVLGALLPGWQVAQPAHAAQAPVTPCTRALHQGGCAMLLLQSTPQAGQVTQTQRTYWAWVVGVELQQSRQRTAPATPAAGRAASGEATGPPLAAGLRPHSRALLAVPFGWAKPWSAGYTARIRMHGPGQCHVDGIYGQRHECRCLSAITLAPSPGSQGDPARATGCAEASLDRPPG